eukprot:gene13235-14594_t
MDCEMELENAHDVYAVVFKTYGEEVVGHVPLELSQIFWKFLSEHGDIEADCIGDRYNARDGKGLELPVDYKFTGNKEELATSLGMKLKLKSDAVPRVAIAGSTSESKTDHLRPVLPNRRNLNLNDAGETDSSTDILKDRHNIENQGDNLCLDDFSDQEHHDLDTDWSSTDENCESGDEDFEPT